MQKLELEKPHKTNTTYSRETAKRALENVIQRIKKVNINKEFIYKITKAVLFGSYSEFMDNQKKWKMKGSRVAYHIIQSFSNKDDITIEQANEIGLKLCKELYPNYQCVISTHVDKGHIHNHISVNAINLSGKKLEDRLANEKEGLYGLSDTSDKIAAEYGCFIMPRKIYHKSKERDYYYQYKKQSWKEQNYLY